MSNRHANWLSCFAAQQGADKALKAVVQRLGGEPWGHSAILEFGRDSLG
jgi:HEPN domain-containing protein